MTRITLTPSDEARRTVKGIYEDVTKRMTAFPEGNCPLELTAAFLRLCLSQSCGKCVPCRIGLERMYSIHEKILNNEGRLSDLELLERTARVVADSSDCAIGFESASIVQRSLAAFGKDYISHIKNNRCTEEFASVPCVEGCPAHVDIPGYIALIGAGRYADAVRLIRKDNPFPSVCGLICEHPCEEHCRRGIVDDAINVRGLKRFAIDNAGCVPAPGKAAATGKSVAVIGGGPAGLTAAYYLSLMGHSVTVFEKRSKLGGMLRYGIPCYRLPDEYLDRDIDVILSTGVAVKYGVNVGVDLTLDELRKKYEAVYVSIGAHSDNKLRIDGENSRGVISAVRLLGDVGEGRAPDFCGKRVVVVGGGNVAMDATRTSMRLGAASVKCVYRRRIADMTALPEEIEGAAAEGCEIVQLMSPVRIEADEKTGNVTALVVKPQLSGPYEKGRPKPVDSDMPEERIPCDIIVVAIGQKIDSAPFEKAGMAANRGAFITGEDMSVSNMDGVFAGGDCVFGPATVIRAIEAGKVAAANIDKYLGYSHMISVDVDIPEASYKYTPAHGRASMQERAAGERKRDFDLMEKGMTAESAALECSRCLRCDHFGCGAFKGGRTTKW